MAQLKTAQEFIAPARGASPGGARRAIGRACACLVLVLSVAVLTGASAPEPDPVSKRWQLDLQPGPLRITTMSVGTTGPRAYFYFTYVVTNNSGQDLLFAPAFELANDEGDVLRSGRQVPLEVTRALISAQDNSFLQDQISIIGQLLQGRENARDGIAIWPANDLNADDVTIYAAGFSGETATVEGPATKQKAVLRKTLMLRYAVHGDLVGQGTRPLDLSEQRWIMR